MFGSIAVTVRTHHEGPTVLVNLTPAQSYLERDHGAAPSQELSPGAAAPTAKKRKDEAAENEVVFVGKIKLNITQCTLTGKIKRVTLTANEGVLLSTWLAPKDDQEDVEEGAVLGVGRPLARKEVESYLRKILLQQISTRRLAIETMSVSVEHTTEFFRKVEADSTADRVDIIFCAVFAYTLFNSEGRRRESSEEK